MSNKKIIIYTTTYCPYCISAKELLKSKKLEYQEIILDNDPVGREELVKKAFGRKTVPQIFIGDYHVGGCDDLYEHDKNGKLNEIIFS